MTFLSITHRPARFAFGGALHAVADAFRSLAQELSFRRASNALQHFDDAMLQDIGVARGDIEAAVRHGRAGLSR